MASQNVIASLENRLGVRRVSGAEAMRTNVGIWERLVSTAAGGLLVTWGLAKRSPAGFAGAAVGAELVFRGLTGHCILYGAMGVNTAGARKPGGEIRPDAPEVRRSITIGRSPEELYDFWHDPIHLAQIVAHFAVVTPRPNGITHWRIDGPLKQTVEWDSRYTEEQPGGKLAWQSIPGSNLVNRGEITFRPGPDETGTEVTLDMRFEPPLGSVGTAIANALHKLSSGVAGQTLRRFKSLVETGEIPTLAHNPSGRGSSDRF